MTDPFNPLEDLRLQNLHHYHILDTGNEQAFQDIAEDTQFLLKAPTVLVSFMDRGRQHMKACIGNSGEDVPRENTFCQYTVQGQGPLVVEDATEHPIFHSFPAVVGDPHVRSYLGVPITSPEGFHIGTLCVIDYVPRTFSSADQETLVRLAKRTMHEVEQRLIQTRYARVMQDLQLVMQAAPNGFVLLDEAFHVLGANDAARHITGMAFVSGERVTLDLFTVDTEVSVLEPIYSAPNHHGWFTLQAVDLPEKRTLWVLEDITDHIQNQLYFQQMAFRDTLTGLPNRRAFEEDLHTELSRAHRHSHTLGVVMIDLDGLKTVNDTLGHEAGDRLLRRFAECLTVQMRAEDHCYRLGGDEYAVILPHADPGQRTDVLRRIEGLGETLRNEGFVGTGVSVGLAHFPQDASTAEQLVRLADQRMYQMKQHHHKQSKA